MGSDEMHPLSLSLSQDITSLSLSKHITIPSTHSVLTHYGISIPCVRIRTSCAISSPTIGAREILVSTTCMTTFWLMGVACLAGIIAYFLSWHLVVVVMVVVA